jgi:hypothetical protein
MRRQRPDDSRMRSAQVAQDAVRRKEQRLRREGDSEGDELAQCRRCGGTGTRV